MKNPVSTLTALLMLACLLLTTAAAALSNHTTTTFPHPIQRLNNGTLQIHVHDAAKQPGTNNAPRLDCAHIFLTRGGEKSTCGPSTQQGFTERVPTAKAEDCGVIRHFVGRDYGYWAGTEWKGAWCATVLYSFGTCQYSVARTVQSLSVARTGTGDIFKTLDFVLNPDNGYIVDGRVAAEGIMKNCEGPDDPEILWILGAQLATGKQGADTNQTI